MLRASFPMAAVPDTLDPASLGSLARRTHVVAATMLVTTATFIIAKTGRDAMYFANGGIFDLPRAYIGIALLSFPVALGALGLMRAIGPRRARVVAPLVLAALLVWFAQEAHSGGGSFMTVFFMVVTLAFGVLFSMIWLLTADLLQGTSREQLAGAYREIGVASILGGMLGGVFARVLAPRIEPSGLVLLAAGLLVVAAAGVVAIQSACPAGGLRCLTHGRHVPGGGHDAGTTHLSADSGPAAITQMSSSPTMRPTLSAAREVLRDRYTTRMLVVGMLAAAVGVLIEFQFYLTIAAMGRGNREQAGLFANAYLWLNGLALALQFWALPRLQRAVGAGGALLVLPGVLLGGGLTVLISASAMLRAALRVAEGGFKSSIHRTSWEQAYLPFDHGRRAIAKLIVDGLGTPAAEGLTAGALLLWTRGLSQTEPFARFSPTLLALSVVVFTVSWILATARIRAGAGSGNRQGESEVFSAATPPPGHCPTTATLGEGLLQRDLRDSTGSQPRAPVEP